MPLGELGGLTLELGVGSPGLLKASWASKLEKPGLAEGWKENGPGRCLPWVGWEGAVDKERGSSTCGLPACCLGRIHWALARLTRGALLDPGFPVGSVSHQGHAFPKASGEALDVVIACPQNGA